MTILKHIGMASRGDASPNVSSRVISTQVPDIRSDTSTSYLLLAAADDDDDVLVSMVLFVIGSLLLASLLSLCEST